MAVSAFKSSSKRGTLLNSSTSSTAKTISSDKDLSKTSTSTSTKAPPRRSRSVSAFSRTHLVDISSNDDFLIKRDNPLFSSSNSPPAEVVDSKSDQIPATKLKATSAEDTRRGRTVSRNADAGEPTSGIGRSLSRVDAGRRHRSVSRHPVARGQYGNSEVYPFVISVKLYIYLFILGAMRTSKVACHIICMASDVAYDLSMFQSCKRKISLRSFKQTIQ